MTSEDKSTVRRGRALAVAGLAAALAGSGFIAAGAANAATTPAPTAPSLKITAPASVTNDGTGSGTVSIEINNSQAGNQPIGSTPVGTTNYTVAPATLKVVITAPSGVLCSNITLTEDSSNPPGETFPNFTVTGTSGTCTYTDAAYTQDPNSDYTFNYNASVDATGSTTPTGTITGSATLSEVVTTVSNGNTQTISATSNTTSTVLAAPAAPTFSTATPPPGTVFNPYSFTAVATQGVPTTTNYRAFGTPINKTENNDTTYENGVNRSAIYSVPSGNGASTGDQAIYLDNGFYFDVVTGKIVNNGFNGTSAFPEYKWTIIANNDEGGATTTQIEGNGGTTAQPTPQINLHDVLSPAYTLTELFSDVSATSTFAQAIYALGDENVIGGYADGTFRPTVAVSRQAFAHFIAGITGGDTGPCSTIRPSAFKDVPNNSQFCSEIRDLAAIGVVNGYSDGTYKPAKAISRQAIAAMVYRAYQYEVTDGNPAGGNADAVCTSPTGFNDVSTSNPFCGDIEFLARQGIAKGYSDGGYHPTANASRQAIAQFLYNAFESFLP